MLSGPEPISQRPNVTKMSIPSSAASLGRPRGCLGGHHFGITCPGRREEPGAEA